MQLERIVGLNSLEKVEGQGLRGYGSPRGESSGRIFFVLLCSFCFALYGWSSVLTEGASRRPPPLAKLPEGPGSRCERMPAGLPGILQHRGHEPASMQKLPTGKPEKPATEAFKIESRILEVSVLLCSGCSPFLSEFPVNFVRFQTFSFHQR